jgi:hypothetical protein
VTFSQQGNTKDGRPTKRPKIEEAAASQSTQSSNADGGGITPYVEGATRNEDGNSGTPSLPLQQAEQDNSQTQVDDDETQFTFGAPSLLQQETSEENTLLNQQSQGQVEPKEAGTSTSVNPTEDASTVLEGSTRVAIPNGADEEVIQVTESSQEN